MFAPGSLRPRAALEALSLYYALCVKQ